MRHFVIASWGSAGFWKVRKGGPQKSIALIRSKRTLALRVLGFFSSSIVVAITSIPSSPQLVEVFCSEASTTHGLLWQGSSGD